MRFWATESKNNKQIKWMWSADSAPTDHSVSLLCCCTTPLHLSWMCFLLFLTREESPQTFPAHTLSHTVLTLCFFLSPPFSAHTNLTVHGYLHDSWYDIVYNCVCVQVWFMWKVAKRWCMSNSVFMLLFVAINMQLCLSFAADVWDSVFDRMPVCAEQMWTPACECACVCMCVCSRCPVFCSVPQTGWSLLLLPRADWPGHVLLCLQGRATPPPL